MQNWRTKKIKALANAFLALKSESEMMSFLRDLCTIEELEELSGRWEAAEMLNKKISYRDIARETGLSTTTVTRIAHWLYHGEGGYQNVLDKKSRRK